MNSPETTHTAEVRKSKSNQSSYLTLDAWRGLASLWVVMFHMSEVMIVSYPGLADVPLYRFSMQGSLGVQMFFVISGYCIANAGYRSLPRNQGFIPFMKARMRRIYPPMWFALACASGLSILASWLVASHHLKSSVMAEHGVLHQSVAYYIANGTLTQAILRQGFLLPQCWTLCYEMAFYLLLGLALIPALHSKMRFPLLQTLHGLTCMVLIVLIAAPHWINYPLDLWPQFALGILAFDVLSHPTDKKPKIWMAAVSLLVSVFALTQNYAIGLFGESSRPSFLFCLLFTIAIMGLYRYENRLRRLLPIKLLSSVGLYSYSLYLTHTFVIGIINQALKARHLPSSYHYLLFALFMVLSLGFARIFFQFFECPYMGAHKKPAPAAVLPPNVALESG